MSQTHAQHAPAQGRGDIAKGASVGAEWTFRLIPILFRLAGFVLSLGFLLVFGFFFDRPSRVPAPDNEKTFFTAGRILSAVFHAALSLFLLCQFGPIGFVHLPLAVLVVARRRSAFRGVPYKVKALTNDAAKVLGAREEGEVASADSIRNAHRFKLAVLVLMGLTAICGILALFKLPVSGFILAFGGATWGLWMFIAWKAAGMNIATEDYNRAAYDEFIGILRQVFGGSAADWEDVALDLDADGNLIATNPPLSAVMRHDDADAILAKVAPEWELDESSTQRRLVLAPVSDETLTRRAEEARSGGLIAGRVDTMTDAPAPTATVTIADADFFA